MTHEPPLARREAGLEPTGRSPGFRVGCEPGPGSPSHAQSGAVGAVRTGRSRLSRLPLRGQRRNLHRLPVLPDSSPGSPIGGATLGNLLGRCQETRASYGVQGPRLRCIITTWFRPGNAGPGDGAIRIPRDGARGRARGGGCRAALLPARCRSASQGRQVAGHGRRRRNRAGDPQHHLRALSRRTASTARRPAARRSTPSTSGSSIRSTARRRSCASTRCSRRRSR